MIMNELQNIRNYLIDWFIKDNLVNTITTVSEDLIDTNKDTIYPLVNLDYLNTIVQEDVILVNYRIKALDQNDVYTTTTNSKILVDTNEQDIMNETFVICQSFINSFRQYNDFGIEIVSVTPLNPIVKQYLNQLSGHSFDIVLSIENIGKSCP